MKNYTLYLLVAALYFLSIQPSYTQTIANKKRVLFVGNSYTYQWNLPQQVAAMSQETGDDLYIRQSTAGGVNWGQHWRGEKGLKTRDKIRTGDYDFVILQNHSLRTIEAPDSMLIYGKQFAEEIRQSGAQAILYMTWAREWNPLMIDTIDEVYTRLGKEIDAAVVPVGRMWQKVKMVRPDIQLHQVDGSHQTPAGMYIAACAFYSALTGKTPIGLSARNFMEDENGERVYLNIQSNQDAQFFQEIVASIMSQIMD